MSGFTKLFASIVHSTIWRAPDSVRLVWVTMLALSNRKGIVEASMPGLADAARVSLPECESALRDLMAPDEYSRTKDHEGRKIEPVDGGWRLLNYAKYREIRSDDQTREATRERVARFRKRNADSNASNAKKRSVTRRNAIAEAEAEAENVYSAAALPAPSAAGDVAPVAPVDDLSSNGAVPAINPLEKGAERRIFDYWALKTGRPKAKLTADRARKIRARLTDGYSESEIMRSIDGYATSRFHQGENDRGQRYDDLTLICRDGAHVEAFAAPAGTLPLPATRSLASEAPRPSQAALARQASVEAFIRGGLLDRQGVERRNGGAGSVLSGSGHDTGDADAPGGSVPPGPAIPDR